MIFSFEELWGAKILLDKELTRLHPCVRAYELDVITHETITPVLTIFHPRRFENGVRFLILNAGMEVEDSVCGWCVFNIYVSGRMYYSVSSDWEKNKTEIQSVFSFFSKGNDRLLTEDGSQSFDVALDFIPQKPYILEVEV
jgi:hypothetical protein